MRLLRRGPSMCPPRRLLDAMTRGDHAVPTAGSIQKVHHTTPQPEGVTMKRHTLSRLTAITLACITVGAIAGCTQLPPEVEHQVVIAAAVEGSPFIGPLQAEAIADRVSTVGDRVTIIVPDGIPHVVADINVESLPDNAFDRSDDLEQIRQQVSDAILSARADDAETDYAEAIALAANALTSSGGARSVTVLGSGIVTTGAMSMLSGSLDESPEAVIGRLREANAIPALPEGVSVSFPRIGITASPQSPLTSSLTEALKAQWEGYLRQAGAAEVSFDVEQFTQRPFDDVDLPTVTPLPVARVASECANSLEQTQVLFNADEATFVDKDAAISAIQAVAQQLAACQGTVNVEGSTSSEGSREVNLALANDRALAVAAPLADAMGIPLSSIAVTSWGPDWPCRIEDRDEAGQLVEYLAAANRTVIVSRGLEPGTC